MATATLTTPSARPVWHHYAAVVLVLFLAHLLVWPAAVLYALLLTAAAVSAYCCCRDTLLPFVARFTRTLAYALADGRHDRRVPAPAPADPWDGWDEPIPYALAPAPAPAPVLPTAPTVYVTPYAAVSSVDYATTPAAGCAILTAVVDVRTALPAGAEPLAYSDAQNAPQTAPTPETTPESPTPVAEAPGAVLCVVEAIPVAPVDPLRSRLLAFALEWYAYRLSRADAPAVRTAA